MKKCDERDRRRVIDYISSEIEMNLFIYGDIDGYGFDSNECEIYVNEIKQEIDWVLCVFRTVNFVFYSKKMDFDIDSIVGFLKKRTISCLSGKSELIERIAYYFGDYRIKKTFMTRANLLSLKDNFHFESNEELRLIKSDEDIEKSVSLIETIDEFKSSNSSRTHQEAFNNMKKSTEHGSLCVGLFKNDELLSVASTTADSSISAMVVGVATKKEARGHGYASKSIKYLLKLNYEKGRKFLCLFYDNPLAGKIYHKAGFTDIGSYAMMIKQD